MRDVVLGCVYSEGISAVENCLKGLMRGVCMGVFVLECGELGL